MKKSHIVLLVLAAAAICVVVSAFSNFSSYETFASASSAPGTEYKVIGTVERDSSTQYDAKVDPNRFVFWAKDKSNHVCKVVYHGGKPGADIGAAEQVVMTGSMKGNEFHVAADHIQYKCPSKYKKTGA